MSTKLSRIPEYEPFNDPALWARFRSQLDTSGACWIWTGSHFTSGYGRLHTHGKTWHTHVLSWVLHHHRFIPDNLWVLHSCDNRACVNPDHLRLGTPQENADDMVQRRRSAAGDKNGSRLHPERLTRGITHHRAKLTEADVLAIRGAYDAGEASQGQLARRYGVLQNTVSEIVRRRIWRHLP